MKKSDVMQDLETKLKEKDYYTVRSVVEYLKCNMRHAKISLDQQTKEGDLSYSDKYVDMMVRAPRKEINKLKKQIDKAVLSQVTLDGDKPVINWKGFQYFVTPIRCESIYCHTHRDGSYSNHLIGDGLISRFLETPVRKTEKGKSKAEIWVRYIPK